MKNRNKKGQFARNETKNIVAVMVTVFIVISIAFFAKEQAIRHNMVLVEQAKAETHVPDKHCITAGKGTGKITSYCADTEDNLLEAINTKWEEPKKEAPQAPKITSKSKYVRKGSNPQIEALIRAEAEKQGYADVELALDIADCESLFDPNARNNKGNTPSYSTDWGLWQYNDYWQRNNLTKECMLDVECSTRQAIKDLKAGKAHQWSCYRKVR